MSATSQFQPQIIKPPIYIQTNGFTLRTLLASDVTLRFLEWINSPSLMAGLNLKPVNFTHNSLVQFINSFDNYNSYMVGIFDAENHALIGFYTLDVNRVQKTGSITTAIGENAYEGKGSLWATIDALLDYFFMFCDIDKITARVLANNRRMLFNFMGTPRFVFEAKLYKECLGINGQRIDLLLFSTFKDLADLEKTGLSLK